VFYYWKKAQKWWEQNRNPKIYIDRILSNPPQDEDFYSRALWIKSIVDWIRNVSRLSTILGASVSDIRVTRLRYVLNLLERNPEWKMGFSKSLVFTFKDISFRDSLCSLGLPVELSFTGEILKRLGDAALPREPVDSELSSLLHWIFPSEEDAEWIEKIDDQTCRDLFQYFVEADSPRFDPDRKDALLILSTMIRAIGLSSGVRQIPTLRAQDLSSNVFLKLGSVVDTKLENSDLEESRNQIETSIQEARGQITALYFDLESSGVSIEIVYQLERAKQYLDRIQLLLEFSKEESRSAKNILSFFTLMIRKNIETRSLTRFIGQNISLLSKRIVRTNSEVGEHYITTNRTETKKLLGTAIGGGMITAFTVLFKMIISIIPGSAFIIGLIHSTNYSLSFLAIQLSGLTLASKQPANTAPALAQKLNQFQSEAEKDELIDKIVHLVRSQATSIFGNVIGVVPLILLVSFIYELISSVPMISRERADYMIQSHDMLGGTWIFAAFTGVLLFASSLIGGAADNWFKYRKLRRTIARNEKLTSLIGAGAARKASEFLSRNFAGIAGSIGLGFLLGLLPEILKFIGIPLEVRHVTLSFGSVAAALPLLSVSEIFSGTMLRIFVSLLGIGVLNVTVSFALALYVALRSQNLHGAARRTIFKLLLVRFRKRPMSFVWPS